MLKKRDELAKIHNRRAPVAVKISPDLSDEEIHTVADTATKCGIDGVIACNTTNARPPSVSGLRHAAEEGGLSGKPLAARATAVIKYCAPVCPMTLQLSVLAASKASPMPKKNYRPAPNYYKYTPA